ncbi:MAG TPA: hypothetical protein VM869_06295 [Enhygromyxa sp.]|nr:hypothetical protein [Enhygromyxa sp.]
MAPLREPSSGELRLARAIHRGDELAIEWFEAVAYVPARRPTQVIPTPERSAVTRLPVLR